MSVSNRFMSRLLEHLVELLDVPPSHYQRATQRYQSFGDWLHRDGSRVAEYEPQVYAQGSFRLGTAIRPLTKKEEYDLDMVCELILSKSDVSQRDLKELVGTEVKEYAQANNFNEPAEEKKRCWRLNYADGVSFHMDILPAVPDDDEFKRLLVIRGMPAEFAELAIAITDRKHEKYRQISKDWPRSNPRGFAEWFESRMRRISRARSIALVANGAYASVDEVPTWDWKTPLQRAIQILKRHRDVMFQNDMEFKPISMILTSLAARAYDGETELDLALDGILERMPNFVRTQAPRVPNPVNEAEDFADRWASDPRLERNFWSWHAQAIADLNAIRGENRESALQTSLGRIFDVQLGSSQLAEVAGMMTTIVPAATRSPRVVPISVAPQPWQSDD